MSSSDHLWAPRKKGAFSAHSQFGAGDVRREEWVRKFGHPGFVSVISLIKQLELIFPHSKQSLV